MPDPDKQKITCFGAAHVDLIAKAVQPLVPRSSTPGQITQGIGGVASNVARKLARQDIAVHMVSRVGEDREGHFVLQTLEAEGIDTSRILRTRNEQTGCYLAIEDETGEMAMAVSDTRALQHMADEDLATAAAGNLDANWWFLDANLTPAMLDVLVKMDNRPAVAVDAVSVSKVVRLRDRLAEFSLVFCNREEAEALFEQKFASTLEAGQAMAAEAVASVVTDGPRPLCIQSGQDIQQIKVPPTEVVSVNGAGDALIAGTLAALARGMPLSQAAGQGISSAAEQLANGSG
jgi:pseudouridine kinase